MGGVVIVRHNGSFIFYHPELRKSIFLPSLQPSRLQVSVIGGCLAAITDGDCKLSLLKLTWSDIVRMSNTDAAGADAIGPQWQAVQTFNPGWRVVPDWIFQFPAQHYLTDSSVVFSSQYAIDHKRYARLKDKPPPPEHTTRLDLQSFTTD